MKRYVNKYNTQRYLQISLRQWRNRRGGEGRVSPMTSDGEIFADLPGKKGKGENGEEKKENGKKDGGKLKEGKL